MTLEQTDQESEAVRKNAPRVTLAQMEGRIKQKVVRTADNIFDVPSSAPEPFRLLTVCILVLDNGFTIVGKSAPASPENFDKDYGEKLAYEDAIRQLWPLEGYLLREKLAAS